jgi:amino acid transporter
MSNPAPPSPPLPLSLYEQRIHSCGNDITSSCLYTVGLCTAAAGVYAPLSLILIVLMLYLFRSVYGEVCTALPLNGGAYNALLNTTSKATASVAACLTILSYVATGVVSGTDAVHYLANVWTTVDVTTAVIILLGIFALLNLVGITESAAVATTIFLMHCATLTILIVAAAIHYFKNDGNHMYFTVNANASTQPDVVRSIIFGFSTGALGISGFETSANFIEEQQPGVFVKTLRNMWFAVLFFNPLLSFFCIGCLPMEDILTNKSVVLAKLAGTTMGDAFETWVSIDAFLVLSGAVLTSYVGVVGLSKRLAGDRCLPNFLLAANKWRNTNHWLIISFFLICTSMYLLLDGEVESLSAVYTVSFLCVMGMFAVGDMLLKYKRDQMPRDVRSTWAGLICAFLMVMFALGATVADKPVYMKYFVIYASVTGALFALTFFRIRLLKMSLYCFRSIFRGSNQWRGNCDKIVTDAIKSINSTSVVFFSRTDSLSVLNKAILYIRENEQTHWVRIVNVFQDEADIPPKFVEHVEIIDQIYSKIRIDSVLLRGEFGREAIDQVERELGVAKNLMFIAAPGQAFRPKIASLGGVRVITH